MSNMDTQKQPPQGTTRLDGTLDKTLTNWLKTDYAKSLGFHSKSHFVTNAVRDLLFKYSVPNIIDLIRYQTYYELFDNSKSRKIEITINKIGKCCECSECESMKCEHILYLWKIPNEVIHLKQMGFLNPFEYLFAK